MAGGKRHGTGAAINNGRLNRARHGLRIRSSNGPYAQRPASRLRRRTAGAGQSPPIGVSGLCRPWRYVRSQPHSCKGHWKAIARRPCLPARRASVTADTTREVVVRQQGGRRFFRRMYVRLSPGRGLCPPTSGCAFRGRTLLQLSTARRGNAAAFNARSLQIIGYESNRRMSVAIMNEPRRLRCKARRHARISVTRENYARGR